LFPIHSPLLLPPTPTSPLFPYTTLFRSFPSQQPLELVPDVLAFVASELALAPTVIEAYAQRQATVSAHQEQIRLHLGFQGFGPRSEEHTSELQSRVDLVCRLLLEKKKKP